MELKLHMSKKMHVPWLGKKGTTAGHSGARYGVPGSWHAVLRNGACPVANAVGAGQLSQESRTCPSPSPKVMMMMMMVMMMTKTVACRQPA
jgi:hypothetical protein